MNSKKAESKIKKKVIGERETLVKLIDRLGNEFLNEDKRSTSLKLRCNGEETKELLTLFRGIVMVKELFLEALD
jgi:hypothetical protein